MLYITHDTSQTVTNNDKVLHYEQLDSIQDSSILSINLQNTLDYIDNRPICLQKCIQKLRKNGTLELEGLDVLEIAKQVVIGQLTIDDINKLLYNNKKSIDNLFKLLNYLSELSMTIIDKRLNNCTYYIKAQKQ